MSCCENHQNRQNDQNHDHHADKSKKNMHNWMMILCCVLPIVLAGILILGGFASGKLGTGLLFLLILLCPLSHMLIMPYMMQRSNKHS